MSLEWTMADAWVFAAIANSRSTRGHRLTEVIGTADAINHSVLLEAEFTRSVGRLISAGLIEADHERDRYKPTAAGADLRRHWRGGMFEWLNSILPQLHRLGEPRDADWSLPAGAFESAVRDYRDRAAKWIKPRKLGK